jgi:hypothetical protein
VNGLRFTFPATGVVTAASQVEAVARTLCSLPAFPDAPIVCPADFGISYDVQFSDGDDPRSPVEVHPSGCPDVLGLGRARWATPALWPILGAAMDMPRADQATFAGAAPTT